jgi:hypothetical protein
MKISSKEYINNQIQWLKLYQEAEVRAVREAVNKVETTNNQKFEAQNEWRSQFKDQTSTFVTRRELWGAVLAILALVISMAAIILTRK